MLLLAMKLLNESMVASIASAAGATFARSFPAWP